MDIVPLKGDVVATMAKTEKPGEMHDHTWLDGSITRCSQIYNGVLSTATGSEIERDDRWDSVLTLCPVVDPEPESDSFLPIGSESLLPIHYHQVEQKCVLFRLTHLTDRYGRGLSFTTAQVTVARSLCTDAAISVNNFFQYCCRQKSQPDLNGITVEAARVLFESMHIPPSQEIADLAFALTHTGSPWFTSNVALRASMVNDKAPDLLNRAVDKISIFRHIAFLFPSDVRYTVQKHQLLQPIALGCAAGLLHLSRKVGLGKSWKAAMMRFVLELALSVATSRHAATLNDTTRDQLEHCYMEELLKTTFPGKVLLALRERSWFCLLGHSLLSLVPFVYRIPLHAAWNHWMPDFKLGRYCRSFDAARSEEIPAPREGCWWKTLQTPVPKVGVVPYVNLGPELSTEGPIYANTVGNMEASFSTRHAPELPYQPTLEFQQFALNYTDVVIKRLKTVRGCPISLNQWYKRYNQDKLKTYALQNNAYWKARDHTNVGFDVASAFIKVEPSVPKEEALKPRIIQATQWPVQSRYEAYKLQSRIKQLFDGKTIIDLGNGKTFTCLYAAGNTPEDHAQWLSQHCAKPIVECDIKKYDGSFHHLANECESQLLCSFLSENIQLRELQVGRDGLEHTTNPRERTLNVHLEIKRAAHSTRGRVYKYIKGKKLLVAEYFVDNQRRSGDPQTSFGNTFWTTCVHVFAALSLGLDHVDVIILGDDSLTALDVDLLNGPLSREKLLAAYEDRIKQCGHTPAVNWQSVAHSEVSFCSRKLIHTETGFSMAPGPGRYVAKGFHLRTKPIAAQGLNTADALANAFVASKQDTYDQGGCNVPILREALEPFVTTRAVCPTAYAANYRLLAQRYRLSRDSIDSIIRDIKNGTDLALNRAWRSVCLSDFGEVGDVPIYGCPVAQYGVSQDVEQCVGFVTRRCAYAFGDTTSKVGFSSKLVFDTRTCTYYREDKARGPILSRGQNIKIKHVRHTQLPNQRHAQTKTEETNPIAGKLHACLEKIRGSFWRYPRQGSGESGRVF